MPDCHGLRQVEFSGLDPCPTCGGTGEVSRCPVCGERRDRTPDDLTVLLRDFGVVGERLDPGGRVLTFMDGRTLRIQDQCSWCDARTIADFLEEGVQT